MNFGDIKKISIVGGPSSGKSTLAENIGRKLDLPITHMDAINYNANWEEVDPKKRDDIYRRIIKEPKWVMDGTYMDTLRERMLASELIIFLDYSTIAKVLGIIIRTLKFKGGERKEIPGCNEKIDFEFIKFTATWNSKKRKKVYKAFEGIAKEKILIFKNRKKLNKWYIDNFGEKVNVDFLK